MEGISETNVSFPRAEKVIAFITHQTLLKNRQKTLVGTDNEVF